MLIAPPGILFIFFILLAFSPIIIVAISWWSYRLASEMILENTDSETLPTIKSNGKPYPVRCLSIFCATGYASWIALLLIAVDLGNDFAIPDEAKYTIIFSASGIAGFVASVLYWYLILRILMTRADNSGDAIKKRMLKNYLMTLVFLPTLLFLVTFTGGFLWLM